MPRKILIIGGSGYLGTWLALLTKTTWDVTATYLTHPGDIPGVNWHRLDVRDAEAVATLMKAVRPAVVVHTAATHPGSGHPDLEAVNVAGSRNIARAAAEITARLIHISTDMVFDGSKGRYVESDPPAPITPYGRSKARAEEEVLAAGGETVIVRTSLIYGWRPRLARQVRWIVEKVQAGQPVHLFTDEIRCPIWVRTLAAAVIELAEMDYTGLLHVAGEQPLSRYAFGIRLLRHCGLDTAAAIPTTIRESGLLRPPDCTLDCTLARSLLQTPLPGVDEVLAQTDLTGECDA